MENLVQVHPLSSDPTALWNQLSLNQCKIDINVPQHLSTILQKPPEENVLRFVCMSDTHSKHTQCTVPYGDIFIHAGDFTKEGHRQEIVAFNHWLGTLPHKYKIVVAGNHELPFDNRFMAQHLGINGISIENPRQDLTNCIYLEDSGAQVCGIKIYGSPWQPMHFGYRAFKLPRGQQCLSKWNMIPDDTDVLITHGPPLGHGDLTILGKRAGCVELLKTVQTRVRPKSHIFGHIHEGYGATFDGTTLFVNASTCDTLYRPKNAPFVFDLAVPLGWRK